MQQVRIDFDNPGLPQSLGVVEGESQSRIFQATLYKSGAAYTAPAGAVYSIMYRGFGPQNQGWYDTIEDGAGKRAACTVSGNVVTCELARQALRVPGHLTVVLCVSDAKGYMLKSWPIMANVRNDGYEDTGEIEMYFNLSGLAGNYLTQLEKAMADAETTRNNLTSTSAQAKKDIDAKAAETLKTIPESYTELDGNVKKLKEDIVNIQNRIELSAINTEIVFSEQLKSTLKNGATLSDRTITIPSGSFGGSSNIYLVQGIYADKIKGKKILVKIKTTQTGEYEKFKIFAYVGGSAVSCSNVITDFPNINILLEIPEDNKGSKSVQFGLSFQNYSNTSSDDVTITLESVEYSIYETVKYMSDTVNDVSNAVNDVSNNFVIDNTTINLFDKSQADLTGMYNISGKFIINSYQYSTGLIEIKDYTNFSMNRFENTVPVWTLWKKDGTTLVRGVQARYIVIDTTTDSEAVYVRCSFLATEIDTVMIVPNEYPCMSEYFEYNSPRKSLKTQWFGKKAVMIGDSLTQMHYWEEMFAQILGMNYEVEAQSGGNMTAIANFVDNIDSADVMTVWAGTNDWYNGISLGSLLNNDNNTYYGAVQHVCECVSERLPNCKLLLITPLQRLTTNTDDWEVDDRGFRINPTTSKTLEDYANAVVETAEIYGIEILDMFHRGGVNAKNIDTWTSDRLHPNRVCFEKLCWKIIGKVKSM